MEALQMLRSLSEAKILAQTNSLPRTSGAGVSAGPSEHKLEVLGFQGVPCVYS